MKKLVLIFSLVLMSNLISINAKSTSVIPAKVMINPVEECWDEADSATENYCGSSTCSFDYWAGYYTSCLNNAGY